MARQLRPDYPGARHHVMNRGGDRRNVFDSDVDRTRFLVCLNDATSQHGVIVESYCLMGNHYHLSLHCPAGGLSATMQHLAANYTRWYNHDRCADGPLFRSRFHSVSIDSEKQLLAVTRYIHLNPRDLGRDPLTYPWSSYLVYAGERRAPAWLRPEVPLFLSGGRAGHQAFLVGAQLNTQMPSSPSVDDILRVVSHLTAGRPSRMIRRLGIAVAAELTASGANPVWPELGFGSEASYRSAVSRARKAIRADPVQLALYEEVRRQLATSVSDTDVAS